MRPPPKKKRRRKSRLGGSSSARGAVAALRPALYPAAALFWAAGIFLLAGALYPAVGDLFDVAAITTCSVIGAYLPDVGAPDSRVALLFGRHGRDLLAASREGSPATADTHSRKGALFAVLAGAALSFAGPAGVAAFAGLIGAYLLHLVVDAAARHHGLDLRPPKVRNTPAQSHQAEERAASPSSPGCPPPRAGVLSRVVSLPRRKRSPRPEEGRTRAAPHNR